MKLRHTLMMTKNIAKAQNDLFNGLNSSTETQSKTESTETGENSSSEVLKSKRNLRKTAHLAPIHEAESVSLEASVTTTVNASAVAEPTKIEETKSGANANKVLFYQDNSESTSPTCSDSDAPVDASAMIGNTKASLKARSLTDNETKEPSLEKLVEATAQKFVKSAASEIQEPLVATKRPKDEKIAVSEPKKTSSEVQIVVAQEEAPKVIIHETLDKSEEVTDKVFTEPNTVAELDHLQSDEHAEKQVPAEEYKKDDSLQQVEAEIVEPIAVSTNEPTFDVAKSDVVANAEHVEIFSEVNHDVVANAEHVEIISEVNHDAEVKQAVEEPIVPIVEIQLEDEQPNLENNVESSSSDAEVATLVQYEAGDAQVMVEEPAIQQHESEEESKGSHQEVEKAPLEFILESQSESHEELLMEQPKQLSAESREEEQIMSQPAIPEASEEPKPSALVPASLEDEIAHAVFEIQDAEIEPSHINGAAKLVAIAKMTVALQAVRSNDKLLEEEQSKRAANQERIDKLVETIVVLDEYPNEIQVPQSTDELVFGHARVDETGDLKVFSGLTTYSAGFWATITASRLETEWTRLVRETTSSKFSKARFAQWRPRKDECFTPTKLNDPNAVYHILGYDDRKLQLFPGVRLALSEMAENSSPPSTHGTIMWSEKKTGMVLKAASGISKQKEAFSTLMQWLQSKAPIDYFERAQIGEDESQKASVIVHFPPLAVDEINNCVDISVYYATIYKQVFMTVATRAAKPSTIYLSVGKETGNMKVKLAAAFEAYQEFATKLNGADIVFVSE